VRFAAQLLRLAQLLRDISPLQHRRRSVDPIARRTEPARNRD